MTTSSATEVDSHPQCDSTEWIDKTLSDAFDELRLKISNKRKLHPSEEHNRDETLSEFSDAKIYDMINSYHSYCKLCEQHFYSRSVGSDINSFFQKHLNTSYHRQMRALELPPDKEPIFTWEVKFRKGRCHLCDIAGLNSYVLDTKFDTGKLMKQHVCVWDRENRETNEKILRKLTLLKQYCGLTVFREKLMKTVDGIEVCLLCGVRLPWPKEKAVCHLSSDGHYQNFCFFLRKCYNFSPKDVLNGFNLEMVTRSLICRDPPPINNFSECSDDKICSTASNNNENPYPEDEDNLSFSPVHVEQFLKDKEYDFIDDGKCLLCDVPAEPKHLKSEEHQSKARNFKENSLESEKKYVAYCRNRAKRSRMMEVLENLELGKEEPTPRVSSPRKGKDAAKKVPFHVIYLKKLLKEKLELVNFIFTVVTDVEVFCHVCDEHVPVCFEMAHMNGPNHKFHEERWKELKTKIGNDKFFEPFFKLKNSILCLVCGAVLMPSSLYSHLKGETHKRRFEWYSGLTVSTPISSAFIFYKDCWATCTVCNGPLNRKTSTTLKTTLKNITYHWPCPKLKEKSTDKVQDEAGDSKTAEDCMVNGLDFRKVEKTVEELVDVFEQAITKNVLEKIDNIREPTGKVLETDVRLTAETEPSCGCEHPSECSCPAKPTGDSEKREVKEKLQKVVRSETRAEKTEKIAAEGKTSEDGRVKEEKGENAEEHEVLLITGLPKSKRTYDIIYSKFNTYGKIRYVFFEGRSTILAFAKPGVAEIAAKPPCQLLNDHKITLTVSKRKSRTKSEKQHSLHKDLIPLLQDPQKLMDFVLNLIMQSLTASGSLPEKKREEMICNTIIAAVYESYPQARCYPFGSRLSGLTLNNSDLDVFLDCGGMYEGFKNTTSVSERRLVNRVAGLLRKKREITDIIVVDRARVPIVSFLHKPTLMHCDLSFKNGLSIQNTLLIKFMMSLDWRVKPLILFLKNWAKLNDLHGPPNFSSYAISMLVIFYLEQLECPVLPTIESLQNKCTGQRTTIAGWDCSINMNPSDVKKSENKDPLPHLLKGLFKFYANFNYNLNVVSPLTGTILPRKAFSDFSPALPMCYKRQILNIPPPIENLVSSKIPICVIDPFDLSHVLTKSLTSRSLQIFTHLCKKSEEYLKNGITVVAPP